MKNILITRTQEQGKEIAQFLENKGFRTFIEPLFLIEKISIKNLPPATTLIITSSNACETIINSDFPKNIKIYAVGKKTAEKLLKFGFKNIIFPLENSALSLKELFLKTHDSKTDFILYLHGSIISLDFETELKKLGYNIKKILAYKTIEVTDFSAEFLSFSKKNSCNQILFFSQNSVEVFFKLAERHNLLEYFKHSEIFVLSKKILAKVTELGFKNAKLFSKSSILKNFYD